MKKLLLAISIFLLILTLASCARLRCDHVWDAGTLIKADECGEGVKARYTCTLCGKKMKGDASTHYFVADGKTPSSCEGLGYTHYSCARCDEEPYIADFTDAIGHNYSAPIFVSESAYKTTYKKLCLNCGDELFYSTFNETDVEPDFLTDQDQNFSFDIITAMGEDFIKNNLIIFDYYFYHTQYEDRPEARIEFNVTAKGDNVYTITAANNYAYDTTYVAVLGDDMTFDTHPGTELIFKIIEDPNHENSYSYNEGIVFLHKLEKTNGGYYPYQLVSGEDGGHIYIIINKVDGIAIGQTLCLGEITSFEEIAGASDCYFGLVEQISRLGDGSYMISLSEPDLQDVFDELDISYDQEINFDNNAINIETAKANIIDSLYSNEEFVKFLSVLNLSTSKYFEDNGYTAVELSNTKSFMDNISLTPSITFNGGVVETKVLGTVAIPIKDSKNELLGLFAVNFEISMESRFQLDVSYKIKTSLFGIKFNNFDLEITQTDTVGLTFGISIELSDYAESEYVINTATGELHRSCCVYVTRADEGISFEGVSANEAENVSERCSYCNPLNDGNTAEEDFEAYYTEMLNCSDWKQTADDIKAWANSDKSSSSNGERGIDLGTFDIPIYGPVTARLELDLVMSLNLEAIMQYKYAYEKTYTYGMSLGSDQSLHPQFPKSTGSSLTENDLSIMGKAQIEMGLLVDMGVIIKGLEKWFNAGISAEVGAYTDVSGILNITNNYVGAYLDAGVYLKLDMYYKIISASGSKDLAEKKWSILNMGFENVYYAYDVYFDSVNIGICNDHVDIAGTFLNVRYFNLKTMQDRVGQLSLYESSKYKVNVSLANGTYCSIINGQIVVKEDCPDNFTDKLIITVEATNDWKEYKYSSNAYYLGEYVIDLIFTPEHSHHSMSSATCTAPSTCYFCGLTEGVELGHVWVDPTCTDAEYCTRCGETRAEALRHDYSEWAVLYEATCTTNEFQHQICSRCGNESIKEMPDTLWSHYYAPDSYRHYKDATCETNALETAKCANSNCKSIDIREVPETALGHSFTQYGIIEEATCLTDEVQCAICDNEGCNKENIKTIDGSALGHSFTQYEVIVDPTCLTDGTERAKCDHEGCEEENIRNMDNSALGHSFTQYEVIVEPTCLTDGTERAVCDHEGCQEEDVRNMDNSALGHSFTYYEIIFEATCTEDEVLLAVCDHEGCDKEDERISENSALGHDWMVANCYDPKTCARCELTEGNPLGHNIIEVSCQMPEHCDRCGETWGDVIDCIESDWIVDKPVTKQEDGYRHTECIMCGVHIKEEVLNFYGSIGLEYELSSDGKSYTLVGIGTCTDTQIIIPEIYNGLPVTRISAFAFESITTITSFYIPNTISHIETFAFSDCTNLTYIEYDGTTTAWLSISKGFEWKFNTGNFTVKCTDGTLSKSNS